MSEERKDIVDGGEWVPQRIVKYGLLKLTIYFIFVVYETNTILP